MNEFIDGWVRGSSSPWASERLGIARLEWCLESLRDLGIEVNPSSRLPGALRRLCDIRVDPAALGDPKVRDLAVEAQRTAWEFMVILMARLESSNAGTVFTNEKIRLALDGAPTADEANTIGRDTQFELYIPALFSIAGFEVVCGATDAQWIFNGERLEIEAKRMKSQTESRLRSNLERAANQILGPKSTGAIDVVRGRGLIAVNVDIHFSSVGRTASDADLIKQFDDRLAVLDRAGRVLLARYGLVGVLAVGFVAYWNLPADDTGHPQLGIIYPMRWASLVGDDPAEHASGDRFKAAITAIMCKARALCPAVPRRQTP